MPTSPSPSPTCPQQLLVILVLLQLHLVRRLLETYFVMIYPPGAKMHLIAYVFGLSYYTGEEGPVPRGFAAEVSHPSTPLPFPAPSSQWCLCPSSLIGISLLYCRG